MTVEPDLVTLYAIRYCLSRRSYAFADGLALIETNHDMLRSNGWARTVADDLTVVLITEERPTGRTLPESELDRCRLLLSRLGFPEAARIGVNG